MTLKEKIMFKIFMSMVNKSTRGVPPPLYEAGMVQDYDVQMRDGTKLCTHVYFPNRAGKFPVILVRSPYVYGLDIQKLIFTKYIEYGFILCYQEVRGRGESEGKWQPFVNEANDTADTLSWLKKQAFCTKGIALLGNSYLSAVHLLALNDWGEDVKTAFLPVFGDNLYDVAYQNGMVKKDFMVTWNLQNNETKNLEGEELNAAYKKAMDAADIRSAMQAAGLNQVAFYDELINNPRETDEFWSKFCTPSAASVAVPICLVGGWYDFALCGQMRLFEQLNQNVKSKSRFIIGAWNHALMNKGDLKAPNNDIAGIAAIALGLEWFMHIFYQLPLKESYVYKYYDILGGEYKCVNELPATVDKSLYLNENKLCLQSFDNGGTVQFIHDPLNPLPTCGGGGLSPRLMPKKGDPKQYNALIPPLDSTKAVVFESDIYSEDKSYFGTSELKLELSSSCDDTAICAKLCLKKGSKQYYVTSSIAALTSLVPSYKAGEKVSISLKLNPVSFTVKKGWRLSLIVCSSDYPSFASHDNGNGAVARNTLYLDNSQLILREVKNG